MNSNDGSMAWHHPRKRFGQHFLHDRQVLERIARAGCAGNPCNLLEIGPGLGALTEMLLERLPEITAVELDRDLVARLAGRFGSDRLKLVQKDILCCDLADLPRRSPDMPFRVVGNLPYNISTPLLFHLMDQLPQIEIMVFMVQKEVAARLAATPGEKVYGRLSVMVALELECERLFDVPPEAFTPPPKVDSSIVRLVPRPDPMAMDRKLVGRLVSAAFAQRRKTLRNTLRELVTPAQFREAGIDPSLRAEALGPGDFVRLSAAINPEQ